MSGGSQALKIRTNWADNNYAMSSGGILLPRTLPQVRSDLGIGRQSQDIYYGGANGLIVNTIVPPAWAVEIEIEHHTSGGGASSGAACTTTTTAISGGAGGSGGCYFPPKRYNIDQLIALYGGSRATPFILTLGATGKGGAGVTGAAAIVPGNNGTDGGLNSLTFNGGVITRVLGGKGSTAGSGATGSSGGSISGVTNTGGIPSTNGGSSSISAAPSNGSSSNQLYVSCGGGAGGGLTTGNTGFTGGSGARGGLALREALETPSTPGVNAVAVTLNGVPVPGNSGAGGTSSPTVATIGHDGVNGGGGGGSSASRTASLKAGDGGQSWAVIKFYGATPFSAQTDLIQPGGRLTASSTLAYTFADTTTTTLYYLPHIHNQLPLFDGTSWVTTTFTSLSINLAGLLAGVYDVFAYISTSGTVFLDLSAWTNNSVRATNLARQDGVLVRSGSPIRRFLGSVYLSTTGTITYGKNKAHISNYYNRVNSVFGRTEPQSGWSPTATNITEPWGNSAAQPSAGLLNRFEFVNCFPLEGITMTQQSQMQAAVGGGFLMAITLDNTTVYAGIQGIFPYVTVNNQMLLYQAIASENMPEGFHFLQVIQNQNIANCSFGSNNSSGFQGRWFQ